MTVKFPDGWAIFRLQPRDKVPLPNTRGCLDATSDPAKLAEMWSGKYASCNIGLATGAVSGVVVLDVDDYAGGADSLAKLMEWAGPLPPTVVSLTGGGGRQFFFKAPDMRVVRNAKRLHGYAGIDVRGDGGYIVLPPSIHPSGEAYRWAPGCSPDEIELAPMPAWISPTYLKAMTKPAPLAPMGELGDIEARAVAYLDLTGPSISGSHGHNSAMWAARAVVYGFDLGADVGFQILRDYFNPKCSPPWSEQELRHKCEQADIKPFDKPRGWLANACAPSEAFYLSEADRSIVVAGKPVAEYLQQRTEAAIMQSVERLPLRAWISERLDRPGGVWQLASHILAASFRPQPELAVAASLCCWGALLGRKVQTSIGIRPNLYCLGVAESGAGKDSARQAIKRVLEHAGVLEHYLGSEDLASDSALVAEVAAKPSVVYLLDELGHMLAAQRGANAAGHARLIMPTFTRLFSSSGSLFTGKAYADREHKLPLQIHQPHVSLYGTSVPGRLYQALSGDDVADGLLNRFLVWHGEGLPEPNDDANPGLEPSEQLTARIQAWHNFSAHKGQGSGNLAAMQVRPVVVQAADGASAVLKAWLRESDATKRRMMADADWAGVHPLWARAHEQACKLALVLACADAVTEQRLQGSGQVAPAVTGEPVMHAEHAEDAVHLVRELTTGMAEHARQHLAGSATERQQHELLQAIKGLGGAASKSELASKLRAMPKREREQRMAELLEQGRVLEQTMPTKGRPVTVYTLAG